jgi:hypothetical protein
MCPQRGEISPLGRILLPLLGPFFCKKSPNYLSAILSKFVKKGKKSPPIYAEANPNLGFKYFFWVN